VLLSKAVWSVLQGNHPETALKARACWSCGKRTSASLHLTNMVFAVRLAAAFLTVFLNFERSGDK